MKAINIEWDTDCKKDEALLPSEIEIPKGMEDEDEISDYLSDVTGYCHKGYSLIRNINPKNTIISEIINKRWKILTVEEAKKIYSDHGMVQHVECGNISGYISCFDDDETGVYIKPHYTFIPLEKLQKYDNTYE